MTKMVCLATIIFMTAVIIIGSPALSQKTVIDSPLTKSSCYCIRQIIGQIKNPVSVISYVEDTKEMLLVVEQIGVVSRYEIGGSRMDTFLDIQDRVVISEDFGESRGLLSVVLDPSFEVTRKAYAYYIRNDQGKDYAYVSMFNAPNGVVDPASEIFLLRIYQPFVHGNGGPMLFGDDGYLYIFTGDGGEKDDLKGRAQNLNSFHGKVLRIDVKEQRFSEGESEIAIIYAVPKSNPFVNLTNAKSEVFAFGIRNMWGCSQDSKTRPGGTGRIFCAETGTGKYDEINIIQSGRNYGWNLVEGTECRSVNKCAPIENEGLPIYEFSHTSHHSLVGGYVYRGQALSEMAHAGHYIYGDVMTGKTYYLEEISSRKWESFEWNLCDPKNCPPNARESRLKHILAFGQDIQGELYLAMTDELIPGSDTGRILKLEPPNRSAAETNSCAALVIACAMMMVSMINWMG